MAYVPKQLPCFCASLRQATRIITQAYDDALRPTGLTSTQFNLLEAIAMSSEPRTGDLAAALAMDPTTATRTLKLIEQAGLIRLAGVEDRRERRWRLTSLGMGRLSEARPLWQSAQELVEGALGKADAKRLQDLGYRLVVSLAT